MNSKILSSIVSACIALCAAVAVVPASAQFDGPGARPAPTSVKAVLEHPVDDQQVVLRGKLVRQLSKDKYIFSDGKHEIRVEIDREHFPAQAVSPGTLVEIVGEVEKDYLESPEIDVHALRIVQ